jgi:hypothetical protein
LCVLGDDDTVGEDDCFLCVSSHVD